MSLTRLRQISILRGKRKRVLVILRRDHPVFPRDRVPGRNDAHGLTVSPIPGNLVTNLGPFFRRYRVNHCPGNRRTGCPSDVERGFHPEAEPPHHFLNDVLPFMRVGGFKVTRPYHHHVLTVRNLGINVVWENVPGHRVAVRAITGPVLRHVAKEKQLNVTEPMSSTRRYGRRH